MQEKKRIDWIDVARAFALIFVYLGHWITARVETFAYSFHLQLFFIISGFFAIQAGTNIKSFVKKKFLSIGVPMFLWAWISFVYKRFDAESVSMAECKDLFCSPASVQPNYWFFPVLLSVTIVYAYIYIYARIS